MDENWGAGLWPVGPAGILSAMGLFLGRLCQTAFMLGEGGGLSFIETYRLEACRSHRQDACAPNINATRDNCILREPAKRFIV
jgi:hypothetical protein